VFGLNLLFSPGGTRVDYMVAGFLIVLVLEKLFRPWQQEWEREDSVLGSPTSNDSRSSPKRPHDVDDDPVPPIGSLFEDRVQRRRRKVEKPFEDAEAVAILDLMRGMLKVDPNERWTIDRVLESDWMRNWALPALNGAVMSTTLEDPFQ
jgi:serine/threonine protein kinase